MRFAALLRVHFTVRIISYDTEDVTRLIERAPFPLRINGSVYATPSR